MAPLIRAVADRRASSAIRIGRYRICSNFIYIGLGANQSLIGQRCSPNMPRANQKSVLKLRLNSVAASLFISLFALASCSPSGVPQSGKIPQAQPTASAVGRNTDSSPPFPAPTGAQPANEAQKRVLSKLRELAAIEVQARFASMLRDSTGTTRQFWFVADSIGAPARRAGVGPPPKEPRRNLALLVFKPGEIARDPVWAFWITR